MPTANSKTRPTAPNEEPDVPLALWLTRAAFVLSIAIVLTRATMLETLRDALDVAPGSDPVFRAPGPGTSLVLDLVAWLPAILIFGRAAMDRTFQLRLTWAPTLFAILGTWSVISVGWADDKFAALVSAFHLFSAAVFFWSSAHLVRSWRRLRIVAGVCLALLLLYGAQAFTYRFVERAELRADWELNRDKHLHDRGLQPGSFEAQQFESKLLRGEMMGFNASPNSFAAVTVLLVVVTGGIIVQRRVDRDGLGWLLPPLAGLTMGACVIVWCDSKTAFATPMIAGGLLVAIALFRGRLAGRTRWVYIAGVVCFVVGLAAVVGHGLYHGSLVIDSMTFRWRYWVGAARVFASHPLLGVGWDNFGQHYLAARMPVAAEEIRDPHNFLVRFFAELGIVGGVLAVAWQARLWWELTQPPVAETESTSPPRRALPASVVVACTGLIVSVLATVDFGFLAVAGDVGSAYVTLQLLQRLVGGMLVLVGVWSTVVPSMAAPHLDDRPAPWLLYSIVAGLGVFMLHNLVDFSLFEVGPMFLFAFLAGSASGMRPDGGTSPTTPSKGEILALAGSGVIWLIALGAVVVPVIVAEEHAAAADEHVRTNDFGRAVNEYQDAAATVSYNGAYSMSAARLYQGSNLPEQARSAFDAAIAANPSSASYRASRAAFESRREAPNLARLRADYDRALELDPANVPLRLEYAETLERLALPAEARKQIETALSFNDQLRPDEVERLPDAKVQELRAKIDALAR